MTLVGVGVGISQVPVDSHVKAAIETGELTDLEMQEFMLHYAFCSGWPMGSQMNMARHVAQAALAASGS